MSLVRSSPDSAPVRRDANPHRRTPVPGHYRPLRGVAVVPTAPETVSLGPRVPREGRLSEVVT
jgi:hypothetical protein